VGGSSYQGSYYILVRKLLHVFDRNVIQMVLQRILRAKQDFRVCIAFNVGCFSSSTVVHCTPYVGTNVDKICYELVILLLYIVLHMFGINYG